jgi:hypothetical protein
MEDDLCLRSVHLASSGHFAFIVNRSSCRKPALDTIHCPATRTGREWPSGAYYKGGLTLLYSYLADINTPLPVVSWRNSLPFALEIQNCRSMGPLGVSECDL